MERIFIRKLESWKTSVKRKPLIIRGARQVGKSFVVSQFGKDSFEGRIHVVDFEKHPEWHKIFDNDLDPMRILGELEILTGRKITTGRDLLFFDEIQAAPRAISSLRYFYEDLPEMHVIAAGSLLEFALKEISFPVGRVNMMDMYPMNYFEFLKANGEDKLADIIVGTPQKLPETVHARLFKFLRQFMFVGGMPECVEVWRNTKSMADVFSIQSDLLETYRQDFSKYAPYADKRSLTQTLNAVAKYIGHQIKYTRLSDEFSGPAMKKAFELLSMARVINKVPAASPASLPLSQNASEKRFKALLLDMGLMRSLHDLPAKVEFMKSDLLSMYYGSLAEQYAGQEFLSSGMENLHYWSREEKSSSAEVDFLIVRKEGICPVEIKGGAAGKLRSMHLILKSFPGIRQGYVLSEAPYGLIREQRLTFLPLYYAYGLAHDSSS